MIGFNKCRVPVLMYHALEDEAHPAGAKDFGEQVYVLQVEQFRRQMEYLKKAGFVALFLEELMEMEQWPDNAIVLTFDDGHQSNYTLALPILLEFGLKAHFFITTGWLDMPYFLTINQVQALSEKGMQIGSHGVTHKFFTEMKTDEAQEELSKSRDTLQSIIDQPITSFSAPGGRITSAPIEIATALGYTVYCTSRVAMMYPKDGIRNIPRFAVRSNDSLKNFVKMVHGDSLFQFKLTAKSILLNLGKNILGNKEYERIRSMVMSKK